MLARVDAPSINSVLREWITEHGISSLFSYHLTCDAVLHPGITVDEIESVILGFVAKLTGVKNLLIIDGFLYSSEPKVLALFEKMIATLASALETVTVFAKPAKPEKQAANAAATLAMHDVLKKVAPQAAVRDVRTDEFHDRFWLDADRNAGVVMGTSFNGVTKKIALIDHLKSADVAELVRMARAIAT